MSKLCLIAASLVSQGQAPGWQLAVPQTDVPKNTPLATSVAVARLCDSRTAYKPISPTAATYLPEPGRPSAAPASNPARVQIRPISGGQLFQQRWAALRAGKLYNRLAVDSFEKAWINSTYSPTYLEWVNLLSREAQMMAAGQGYNRLSVLLGDSLAQWFPTEQLSSDRYWLNQGISGDTTTGVLNRLSLFDETTPNAIHLMVGINDLRRGATDAEVVSNLIQIMRRLKQFHPQAKIYIYSILPTRLPAIPSSRVRWLNYNVAAAARQEGADFLNLQAVFSDQEGNLRRELTTDGLHLSMMGYEVWRTTLNSIF